jgi:hypothetical protein
MEDWYKHKHGVCDPFLDILSQANAKGYVYLGPCEDQVVKPLDLHPTSPRFLPYHMFQKPDGSIMTMRLHEQHDPKQGSRVV